MNSYTSYHASGEAGERAASANLLTSEAAWGQAGTKTKWVALFTCNFLNPMDSYINVMQGINICMGFQSSMYINANQGEYFATAMCTQGAISDNTIIDSFLDSCLPYQHSHGYNVTATAIYAAGCEDDTIYDYAYTNSRPAPLVSQTTSYYKKTRVIYNNHNSGYSDSNNQIV